MTTKEARAYGFTVLYSEASGRWFYIPTRHAGQVDREGSNFRGPGHATRKAALDALQDELRKVEAKRAAVQRGEKW